MLIPNLHHLVMYAKRDGWVRSAVPGVEPLNGVDAAAGRFTLLEACGNRDVPRHRDARRPEFIREFHRRERHGLNARRVARGNRARDCDQ